jgi:hypothetical protein
MSRTYQASISPEFGKRLSLLDRKHQKLAENGYVRKLGKDGLITIHPRRRGPSFPLQGLLMVFLVAFVFKAFLFATIGEAEYVNRVALLQSGSIAEQAGAWIMQADPATKGLAAFIIEFLN